MLAELVVDWYGARNKLAPALSVLLPKQAAKRALAAQSNELPSNLVRPMNILGLWIRLRQLIYNRLGRTTEGYYVNDAAFARALTSLRLPSHDVFFGYSYEVSGMLQAERSRGIFTVLDQMDPGPVEFRAVADEMRKHPEWAGHPPPFPRAYYDRLRQEWEWADLIVANSDWTREAMISEGVDPGKIEILPLAYETDRPAQARRPFQAGSQLKVLFLGQVNVRKGIHYLVEAARLLEHEPVEFLVAGPLKIRKEATVLASQNVKWLGPVPRNEAAGLYQQCDVFVLPTLSDGFAITQLEALAHGLPVIVTPNCGRVVEDGLTGFVIPPRDPRALAEAILRFIKQPELSFEMSPHCRKAAGAYSVEAYGRSLVDMISQRRQGHVQAY